MTNVLVVDDSAVDRRLIGAVLRKGTDWDVEFAEDGQRAIDSMSVKLFDLVITDLVMPGIDGLKLVNTIRQRHPTVPVILMTAQGSDATAVQALRSGAATYVPKRSLDRDLLDSARSVLARSGEQLRHAQLFQCLQNSQYAFSLRNDTGLFAPLIGYLQDVVTHTGLADESDRVRIGIALEEALANAYYHGNLELDSGLRERDPCAYEERVRARSQESPYRERKIQVKAQISRIEAQFTIGDEGPGFDQSALPDPTNPANMEKITGRGVLLMRSFMDEVRYNDRGNEVTLIKKRAEPKR